MLKVVAQIILLSSSNGSCSSGGTTGSSTSSRAVVALVVVVAAVLVTLKVILHYSNVAISEIFMPKLGYSDQYKCHSNCYNKASEQRFYHQILSMSSTFHFLGSVPRTTYIAITELSVLCPCSWN